MHNSVKKICIVSSGIKMGGVERSSVNIANVIDELGNDVIFVALFKQKHFLKLNSEIKFYEPENFNTKKLYLFKTLKYIRQIITTEKPDSILAYTKFYSALVLLSLVYTKFSVYISERSSPSYKWPLKINIIFRLAVLLKTPAGVIAQTKIAAQYQRMYIKSEIPIKVIPNALRDVTLYPDIKRENIVLAVGRFNDSTKGFDRLIEAFAKAKLNEWNLVFAGGDDKANNLIKLAHELGIADRVKFLGQVEDIDKIFAKASIFVIPSRTEGFPNALCEAMAAGLPCIAFDFIAGPRDLITPDYNGIIVEDGNLEKMAEEIVKLANNPAERLRLGRNAMEIKEKLRGEKIGSDYFEFITSRLQN